MSQQQGAPLPKFGEWDVNNPATAEGFTVIFNKARDEKKTPPTNTMTNPPVTPPPKNGRGEGSRPDQDYEHKRKRWWSCFG